jgi:competence protein ComEC
VSAGEERPELDRAGRPKRADREWHRYRPAWSLETLALHPRHIVLAAFVAGLLAGPRSPAAVIGLVAALLVAAVAIRGGSPIAARVGVIAGVAAVAVLAGAVVAEARLAALDRTSLSPAPSATVRGFVVEAPRRRAWGVRVVAVRPSAGAGEGERVVVRAPPRVRWPAVAVGDEVVARGRLRGLHPHEGFERARTTHAVLEADAISATGRRRASPFDALRRRAERALDAGLDHETAALARGMVLGQDQALGDELREAFHVSGLAHLLAASGSNVMLLATLVLAIAAACGAMLRLRLAIALLAVAAYVPIAGAGASIQRAGIMGAAALVAGLAGRPAMRWYALLLAAVGTLLLNPRAVEDVGWQLSFAAVIAILAFHHRLRTALGARRVPGPLADATALTLVATAGTAPLMALHFEQLSLVSLPANLLAAPAVAPVMWLGTLAGALGSGLAPGLDAVAAFPLAYLAWLARTAADLPMASVPVRLDGAAQLIGAYAALGAIAYAPRILRAPHARRLTALAAAAALVIAAAAAPAPPQPPAGFTVSALDIGQGDAILVQHGAHAVLFDTGPPGGPVVERLRQQGVRRLDAVVLTHTSSDHEGGLTAVLDAVPVDMVVDGRQTRDEQSLDPGGERGETRFAHVPASMPKVVPAAGQTIRAGPMRLDVLWPPPGADRSGDANLTATVALVRDGGRSALLTADAESPVTRPLDLPQQVDVLKVAHHGSRDDGLALLLERVKPRVALISVGRNSYGHPAPETIDALEAVPDVRRTDRGGTQSVTLG